MVGDVFPDQAVIDGAFQRRVDVGVIPCDRRSLFGGLPVRRVAQTFLFVEFFEVQRTQLGQCDPFLLEIGINVILNRITVPCEGDGIDLGLLVGEPGQHIIREEHIAADACGVFLLPGFCAAFAGAPPCGRRQGVAAGDLFAVFIVCGAEFDQGFFCRLLVALLVGDSGGDPFREPGPVRVFAVEDGIVVAFFGLQVAC